MNSLRTVTDLNVKTFNSNDSRNVTCLRGVTFYIIVGLNNRVFFSKLYVTKIRTQTFCSKPELNWKYGYQIKRNCNSISLKIILTAVESISTQSFPSDSEPSVICVANLLCCCVITRNRLTV